MTRWSEDQLSEYMCKAKRENIFRDDEPPDPGPESKLQFKCMRFCRERGFPVFHDHSKKRNQPGWPDMIIFTKNRVVLVELKSATGKLRKDQVDLKRVLTWLGHTVHVCRSYAGFIRIMEEPRA